MKGLKRKISALLLVTLVSCNKEDSFYQQEVADKVGDVSSTTLSDPTKAGPAPVTLVEPPVVVVEPPVVVVEPPVVVVEPPVVVVEPPVDPVTPVEIKLACDKAAQDGLIKERNYDINFEPVLDCQWGLNGNRSRKQSNNCFFNARAEVKKSFILPVEAKRICDLKFNFLNNNLKFDDEMMVTLNDIVLLSSQDFSSSKIDNPNFRLSKDEHGLVRYNWLNMFLAPYYKKNACSQSNKYIEHYCLGYTYNSPEYNLNCKMPPTEVSGPMSVNLPKESIFKLSSTLGFQFDSDFEVGKNKTLNLALVSFGDNDRFDCSQNGAALKVKVKYIE